MKKAIETMPRRTAHHRRRIPASSLGAALAFLLVAASNAPAVDYGVRIAQGHNSVWQNIHEISSSVPVQKNGSCAPAPSTRSGSLPTSNQTTP